MQSDAEPLKVPFIGGNDCVGVVMSVGAGVKHLKENDVVMPMKTGMGTWRSLAVWNEKDLRKLPSAEELPYEYAAMLRACPHSAAFRVNPRRSFDALVAWFLQARCVWRSACCTTLAR